MREFAAGVSEVPKGVQCIPVTEEGVREKSPEV
jgi:hypothetical protein